MHCHDAALAQSKADREWCGEMTRLNDLRGQERDAALARAEAAEQDAERMKDEYFGGRTYDYESSERRALAAESSLAEATDCIKETLAGLDRLRETFVELETEPVDSDLVSADIDDASCPLRVFLSATPAPAATAEPGPERMQARLTALDMQPRVTKAEPGAISAVMRLGNRADALATLVERIEAECNNKMLCAGDLADNILAIIRAAKEGA
jgi:hypothetical protein